MKMFASCAADAVENRSSLSLQDSASASCERGIRAESAALVEDQSAQVSMARPPRGQPRMNANIEEYSIELPAARHSESLLIADNSNRACENQFSPTNLDHLASHLDNLPSKSNYLPGINSVGSSKIRLSSLTQNLLLNKRSSDKGDTPIFEGIPYPSLQRRGLDEHKLLQHRKSDNRVVYDSSLSCADTGCPSSVFLGDSLDDMDGSSPVGVIYRSSSAVDSADTAMEVLAPSDGLKHINTRRYSGREEGFGLGPHVAPLMNGNNALVCEEGGENSVRAKTTSREYRENITRENNNRENINREKNDREIVNCENKSENPPCENEGDMSIEERTRPNYCRSTSALEQECSVREGRNSRMQHSSTMPCEKGDYYDSCRGYVEEGEGNRSGDIFTSIVDSVLTSHFQQNQGVGDRYMSETYSPSSFSLKGGREFVSKEKGEDMYSSPYIHWGGEREELENLDLREKRRPNRRERRLKKFGHRTDNGYNEMGYVDYTGMSNLEVRNTELYSGENYMGGGGVYDKPEDMYRNGQRNYDAREYKPYKHYRLMNSEQYARTDGDHLNSPRYVDITSSEDYYKSYQDYVDYKQSIKDSAHYTSSIHHYEHPHTNRLRKNLPDKHRYYRSETNENYRYDERNSRYFPGGTENTGRKEGAHDHYQEINLSELETKINDGRFPQTYYDKFQRMRRIEITGEDLPRGPKNRAQPEIGPKKDDIAKKIRSSNRSNLTSRKEAPIEITRGEATHVEPKLSENILIRKSPTGANSPRESLTCENLTRENAARENTACEMGEEKNGEKGRENESSMSGFPRLNEGKIPMPPPVPKQSYRAITSHGAAKWGAQKSVEKTAFTYSTSVSSNVAEGTRSSVGLQYAQNHCSINYKSVAGEPKPSLMRVRSAEAVHILPSYENMTAKVLLSLRSEQMLVQCREESKPVSKKKENAQENRNVKNIFDRKQPEIIASEQNNAPRKTEETISPAPECDKTTPHKIEAKKLSEVEEKAMKKTRKVGEKKRKKVVEPVCGEVESSAQIGRSEISKESGEFFLRNFVHTLSWFSAVCTGGCGDFVSRLSGGIRSMIFKRNWFDNVISFFMGFVLYLYVHLFSLFTEPLRKIYSSVLGFNTVVSRDFHLSSMRQYCKSCLGLSRYSSSDDSDTERPPPPPPRKRNSNPRGMPPNSPVSRRKQNELIDEAISAAKKSRVVMLGKGALAVLVLLVLAAKRTGYLYPRRDLHGEMSPNKDIADLSRAVFSDALCTTLPRGVNNRWSFCGKRHHYLSPTLFALLTSRKSYPPMNQLQSLFFKSIKHQIYSASSQSRVDPRYCLELLWGKSYMKHKIAFIEKMMTECSHTVSAILKRVDAGINSLYVAKLANQHI